MRALPFLCLSGCLRSQGQWDKVRVQNSRFSSGGLEIRSHFAEGDVGL